MREFSVSSIRPLSVETFEPCEYIARGDKVMAWANWPAIRDGKVMKFHEYTDTLAGANAFRKESAGAAG